MTNKKILPYIPARLVKGQQAWYILYYQTNPKTGVLKRFRETYNINRVKEISNKIRLAKDICKRINKELPHGFPYVDKNDPSQSSINEALDFFEENKYPAICDDAIRPYKRLVGDIREWIKKKKLKNKLIRDFSELDAIGIMKFIWDKRNISNNSYNRYIKDAIILFNFLKKYKYYLSDNPFLSVSKKRKVEVNYRKLTRAEFRIIKDYVEKVDYWFFLAIILQYACFIRPAQLRRLKFKDFDLNRGIIILSKEITKNNKREIKTIPQKIIHHFRNPEFAKHHANLYVFGSLCQPHSKPIHEDLFGKRWRRYRDRLYKEKKLENIDGMVFYSLKKTGISDAFEDGIKGEFIRRQAGHSTEKITQIYNDVDFINDAMRTFNGGL